MHSPSIGQSKPPAINYFEIVFLSAMVFYAVIPMTVGYLAPGGDFWKHALLTIGTMIGAQIVAMILITRQRRNWAKWLVILLLVLDVPMYMTLLPEQAIRDPVFLVLSLLQFILHFAAIFLLFTPSATKWLCVTEQH